VGTLGFWIFVKRGQILTLFLTSWRNHSKRPSLNSQKLERGHFATRAKIHMQNLASTHTQMQKFMCKIWIQHMPKNKPLVIGAVVVIDDGPLACELRAKERN
jgi:hypothetical protein